MSYTVDIIYSKNQDYSNPQTVTQTGQPSSIELTNLDSDQAYYIKAVLKNDGTVEDEDTSKFTTLSLGALDDYFSINNLSNEKAEFSVINRGGTIVRDLKYSVDNGETWNEYDFTTLPTITVDAGGSIKLKGNNPNNYGYDNPGIGTDIFDDFNFNFHMDKTYSISGNPSSMKDEDPAVFATDTKTPHMGRLFYDEINLVDARGLVTYQYTTMGYMHFRETFRNSGLVYPPSFENVELIVRAGLYYAFYGCSKLKEVCNLSNLKELTDLQSLDNTFGNCVEITKGLNLRNLTTVTGSDGGLASVYDGCTSLAEATAPNIPTWNTQITGNWLNNVAPTGVVYKPANLTIPTNNVSGVPTGWTTQNY